MGIIACQKEELGKNVNDNSSKISNYEESQTRKFKKEVVVYDKTNKNNVMIALHSDDENIISDFLKNNELIINTSDADIVKALSKPVSDYEPIGNDLNHDMVTEPKLVIELIKQNIDSENKYFSLRFESKNYMKNYQSGYPIGFETNSQIIGSVHLGYGYSYFSGYQFKAKWWNTLWDDVYVNGAKSFFVNASPNYYNYYDFSNITTRKRKMTIRPDRRQGGMNYEVFYSKMADNALSRECFLGSYDPNNFGECYYGTVPEGSSAFWHDYGGTTGTWFMYTPVNGTCPWKPEPGSGFDGANCRVVKIPSAIANYGRQYIWRRNLLTESKRFGEI
ncbi:hypothetical protein CW751_14525 [Brumimicrobium salinarum]|uniref:Uncharacterized protein n=2 Tax=Brumimicrobium salinarum TaxID=2058658 RepID=A0A2I0QZ05_9FLAO|nr:hypothetical protein CW751_14525 [Brumimicrobium salinarum]